MIRCLLEMWISRSLDDGKPLPAWVQRLVQRDSALDRFHRRAQQAHLLLHQSAEQQRERLAVSAAKGEPSIDRRLVNLGLSDLGKTRRRNRRRWARVGGAIAACLLALALVGRSQDGAANAAHAQELGQQLAALPPEMLGWLNATMQTSQMQIERCDPTSHLSHLGAALEHQYDLKFVTTINLRPDWSNLDWRSMWEELRPNAKQKRFQEPF